MTTLHTLQKQSEYIYNCIQCGTTSPTTFYIIHTCYGWSLPEILCQSSQCFVFEDPPSSEQVYCTKSYGQTSYRHPPMSTSGTQYNNMLLLFYRIWDLVLGICCIAVVIGLKVSFYQHIHIVYSTYQLQSSIRCIVALLEMDIGLKIRLGSNSKGSNSLLLLPSRILIGGI